MSSESTFDEVGVGPGCGLHGDVYLLFTGVERKSLRTKNTCAPYVVPTGCPTRLRDSTAASSHLYDILAFAENPSTRLFYQFASRNDEKTTSSTRSKPAILCSPGLYRTLTCG